jgi:hypothetical protein
MGFVVASKLVIQEPLGLMAKQSYPCIVRGLRRISSWLRDWRRHACSSRVTAQSPDTYYRQPIQKPDLELDSVDPETPLCVYMAGCNMILTN